jgi:hypothetical protein
MNPDRSPDSAARTSWEEASRQAGATAEQVSLASVRDNSVLLRLALGALTGALAYVAATITTVVVPDDLFWRTLWLALCLVGFVCLLVFLALACRKFDNHPETHS